MKIVKPYTTSAWDKMGNYEQEYSLIQINCQSATRVTFCNEY